MVEPSHELVYYTLNIPVISPEFTAMLEQNLTLEEIATAIISLQIGKAPGSDSSLWCFIKNLEINSPLCFFQFYTEALENNILPPPLCHTSVILLLKDNKDPLDCSSYRPISLTNCDGKV